jgi:chromosome segregation protein
MHLRSITLKGFKSFPDRTKLDFTPGVSVIVGPNGSGKSNITDAVLWAMGEQSPNAVRGQSMQDVIFSGAHGVQARSEAEVEVVLDNADGGIGLPFSEISIARRLDRAGDGEYRINGARCRLGDVIELLSDTGMGKEMHSVVSQGRVEAIVTSKPKDRRMLIEEAAGLGKHRKRRRRAQLKLERTQDNLDRALDVEREARSRLRPLKRQAEAAELHERLERQTDEALWALARDAVRAVGGELQAAEVAVAQARGASAQTEAELAEVAARREQAEHALATRGTSHEGIAGRVYAARSAAERIGIRLDAARAAASLLAERAVQRRARVEVLEAEIEGDTGDDGGEERIAELESELEQLAQDRQQRLAAEIAELEERAAAAEAQTSELTTALQVANEARKAADATSETARRARREAEQAADGARRESARIGADLAAVNQFLRSQAGAPGGAAAFADGLHAEPGYELALAAALGPRLRAAVAADLPEASDLLARAGKDGGAALVARDFDVSHPEGGEGRTRAVGTPLLDVVTADGPAAALARTLLRDAYVVEDIAALPEDFAGVAVTRDGRVWDGIELRQVPAGGEDRVLAERNRRDALVGDVERAAQAEQTAKAALEQTEARVAEADGAREEADRAARAAARAHTDATETARHARKRIEERRKAPDDGPAATRRAQIAAALGAERRLLERAEREREDRRRRLATEQARMARDVALLPRAQRLATALEGAAAAVAARLEVLEADLAADRAAGDRLAGELRACAAQESQVQARLKERGEAVTRAEVRAQQVRDQAQDAREQLTAIATQLGLEDAPAEEALPAEERQNLEGRIERLRRRREQLGPVNPLAQDEYAEAIAHVEELETQREDLESALRELKGLIRDTDKRIRESFEETFTAAAKNFEEVAAQLFPGGKGRLRLVREDSGPRPVLGGQEPASEDAPAPEDRVEEELEAAAEAEERSEEDLLGVEIEITPAGKSTKRLSLLSGGEKSMTALAFLFAVFLARPCPFYILDEVEAALDDLNIDRFLALLGRFSDRAQFIVVTHQKRTMEAADCLYGVSMAGNGVSKVVSRRLPRDPAATAAA